MLRTTVSGPRLLSGAVTEVSAGGGGAAVFGGAAGEDCCAIAAAAAKPAMGKTRSNADNFMGTFIVPGRGSFSHKWDLNKPEPRKLDACYVWGGLKPGDRS